FFWLTVKKPLQRYWCGLSQVTCTPSLPLRRMQRWYLSSTPSWNSGAPPSGRSFIRSWLTAITSQRNQRAPAAHCAEVGSNHAQRSTDESCSPLSSPVASRNLPWHFFCTLRKSE